MDYNDQELEYLREVFKRLNSDGSGNLSLKDFTDLINIFAKQVPEIEFLDTIVIDGVFSYFDIDHDKRLSFQEFYSWWISPNRFKFFIGDVARLMKKARQLYSTYSKKNNNKGISFKEFETLMEELEIPYNNDSFDNLDTNEDGLMNFPEFVDWLKWF